KPGSGPNPRESDDHVFVTYEFPGKSYFVKDDKGKIAMEGSKPKVANPGDVIVVTYTSVNTNGFEQYGECLMGSRGTMVVEGELPKGADPYETDSNGDYVLAKDKRLPKCHGEVAMVDAILALTANMAMKHRTRISYEDNWGWFDDPDPRNAPEAKYGEKKA